MVMKVQNIKPNSGYKQTEAGVIPDDWEVKKLSVITQFTNGKAHEKFIDDKGDYIVVNSKFVSTEGRVFKCSQKNLSPLFIGDIAMVMSDIPNGKALAKCFFVRENGKYTLNQRICSFRSYGLDSQYLFYKLNRNQYFLDFDSGVGQTNLKNDEVLDCPIALPSAKSEQHAIAAALSDIDALITSLDKLIAKKRDIKQATMQQLLTGKTRLPGFSGEWQTKKLGEIAHINMGQSPDSKNYNIKGIGIPLIQGNADIENRKSISRVWTTQITKTCNEGDLIMTVRAPVGSIGIATKDSCLGRGVCSLKPSRDDNHFIFHLMVFLEEKWKVLEQGSTFTSANSSQIIEFSLSIADSLKEQQAIATVLTDMDAEIAALEQRREKTRMLKQGMMQELLTGKTRLV